MDSAEIEAEFARTTYFADPELETALRRDYWWSRNWQRRWPPTQIPLDGTPAATQNPPVMATSNSPS